jgi:hypothetical protein
MGTYTAGAGVDAPCKLKPLSEAQKSRRYRKKARKDETWDLRNARIRARAWADRALTHRDPMIEALFGPAKRPAATLETA